MKKRLMDGVLFFLIVLLVSAFTAASTTPLQSALDAPVQTTSGMHPQPTVVSTAQTTSTSEVTGNWWDKLGVPKYGGTFTYSDPDLQPNFDPMDWRGAHLQVYLDSMFNYDWKLNRDIWNFKTSFVPADYQVGQLVEGWEWKDPTTLIMQVRQGIHWQNKAPVNGREFVAADVEFHYDRLLGTGNGFTEPAPMYIGRTGVLEKVTARGKYTVEAKFKTPSLMGGFYLLLEQAGQNYIEAPEAVKENEGNINNWKVAVGTGPWIITDFVQGSSMIYTKNPNYWGYDERYPQNRLPYIDTIKVIRISDFATQMAALRTGKIDILQNITWDQANSLSKTNYELLKASFPIPGPTLEVRVDRTPFTDIRVRKAMQMSIDRAALAKGLYGGLVEPIPAGIVAPAMTGYNFAYTEWPQELKDEYSYNPSKAKQLLADAGYPDGFKTNILVGGDRALDVLQSIKSFFMDVGIDMDINLMDAPTAIALTAERKYDQIRYDGGGRTGAGAPPHNSVAMHTTGNMANWNMINDATYNGMYDKLNAATDMESARQLIIQMDKYGIEQHWSINTFPTISFTMYQPYLKGYSGEELAREPYWYYAHFWIDKD